MTADHTKRRIIAFWGDEETTARLRDPAMIQLAQREFLRGAEAESQHVNETLRKIHSLADPWREVKQLSADGVTKLLADLSDLLALVEQELDGTPEPEEG